MNDLASDVIKKEMILLQETEHSKQDALQKLVKQAKKLALIQDEEIFLEAVMKREQEVPTAIGYLIAIPHGKSVTVSQPFIGFLQTKEAFVWTDGHEEQVRLIFLIGVPIKNENNIHLKFISQLSKKLLDDTFRNKLLEETDMANVFQLLKSIDV